MSVIHFVFKSRIFRESVWKRVYNKTSGCLLSGFVLTFSSVPLQSQIHAPAVIVTPSSEKTAAAQVKEMSYTCLHKQQIRKLFVSFPNGTPLPCTLDYHKVTESTDGRKTIWSAKQDPDFCENKMIQMVEQFEEWGWDCSEP